MTLADIRGHFYFYAISDNFFDKKQMLKISHLTFL